MIEKYQKYKDCNLKWIGEVPEHWGVGSVKHCFKFKVGFTPPTSIDEFYDSENGVGWVTISDMDKKYVSDSKNKISKKAIEVYSKEIVPEGSLLYSFKLSVGKVAFAGKDIFTNEAIFSILPEENLELSYYYYCLPSILIHNANENIYGAKIFNQEVIKNSRLPIPPKEEQVKIAQYLDHQTAIIDQLILQKEKLIELLKEKRQAVINEAVTKGLDPNAKMKDSGIEWLGEVPEDWVVSKLKYISTVISKGTTPSTEGKGLVDNGIRYLKAENIKDSEVSLSPEFFIDDETHEILKRSQLRENDILFVIAGATIGKVAILPGEFAPSNTNQAVCFIRLKENENHKFIHNWLMSPKIRDQVWLKAVQAAQPNLSMENLGNFSVPYPPKAEQEDIVKFLNQKNNEYASLINNNLTVIEKLKEYRQSIISETVTGKIDVRDWQPKNLQNN
jgi:type I restriction enzyme S subunit